MNKKKKHYTFKDLEVEEANLGKVKQNLLYQIRGVVDEIINSYAWAEVTSDRITLYLYPDSNVFFDEVEEISKGFKTVFGDEFTPFYVEYNDEQGYLSIVFLRGSSHVESLNLNE